MWKHFANNFVEIGAWTCLISDTPNPSRTVLLGISYVHSRTAWLVLVNYYALPPLKKGRSQLTTVYNFHCHARHNWTDGLYLYKQSFRTLCFAPPAVFIDQHLGTWWEGGFSPILNSAMKLKRKLCIVSCHVRSSGKMFPMIWRQNYKCKKRQNSLVIDDVQ